MIGPSFEVRFKSFRILDYLNDSVKTSIPHRSRHPDADFPIFHNGSSKDCSIDGLTNRHRFTCHGGLVHEGFTARHQPIKGNGASHLDTDDIALFHFG